jgi:hypothetical protein
LRVLAVAVLAVVLALSPAQVNAATVTLTPPSADATIKEAFPDDNWGVYPYLDAGRISENGLLIQRSLVKFDLSSIPAGSTIISAEFELRIEGQGGSPDALHTFFFVYRVTHDWVEGDGGLVLGGNGVTWNEANHIVASPGGSIPWTAGGEWTTEDAASAELMWSGGWGITWDVTGIVQDWTCGASNYGFIVRYPTGEQGSLIRFAYFDSKEQGNAPILTVTYGPLTPGVCPAPVGGFMEPVNKVAIAAPYLALFGVVAVAAILVWKRPDN